MDPSELSAGAGHLHRLDSGTVAQSRMELYRVETIVVLTIANCQQAVDSSLRR
jgi:hypothetical protein